MSEVEVTQDNVAALHTSEEWLSEKNNRVATGFGRVAGAAVTAIAAATGNPEALNMDMAGAAVTGSSMGVGGTATLTESNMMATAVDPESTPDDIRQSAERNYKASWLRLLPATAIMLASGSFPRAILNGLMYGVRIAFGVVTARSAKEQMGVYADMREGKTPAIDASNDWLTDQTLRKLPLNMRYAEKYFEYIAGGVSIALGIVALVQAAPLAALLSGANAAYSFWKARKAVPSTTKFYEALNTEVERNLPEQFKSKGQFETQVAAFDKFKEQADEVTQRLHEPSDDVVGKLKALNKAKRDNKSKEVVVQAQTEYEKAEQALREAIEESK